MVRHFRRIASAGAIAAVVLLGSTPARAQVSYRGAGYFGGGFYQGGGYSFERFSIYGWGSPFLSYGYGVPYGYGLPYGYGYGYGYGFPYGSGYGFPYGYGYGYGIPFDYGYGFPNGYVFEPSPVPYPFLTLASYPFFSYITSDQNSRTPKTIEPGKYIRPPAESAPSDDSRYRSGRLSSIRQRGTRGPRLPIVYRADVPRQDSVEQPPQTQTQTHTQAQTRPGRLIVTRATAP